MEEFDFKKATNEVAEKVRKKNEDYGNCLLKVSEILKVLYPKGIPPHDYGKVSLLIRMFDKISRICNEKPLNFNEDSWDDLIGYSLIGKFNFRKE